MPFGLAVVPRGVEDEQRVLGVERLGRVLGGLAGSTIVVPPHVPALGPGDVLAGAADHEHVLDAVGHSATASSTVGLSALTACPRR